LIAKFSTVHSQYGSGGGISEGESAEAAKRGNNNTGKVRLVPNHFVAEKVISTDYKQLPQ
jgi:hypothetical protein